MKIMEFTYTKPNGDSKKRAIMLLQEPQKFFEGIDISDLSEDEFADFVNEYSQAYDKWREMSQTIVTKHDLKHNYRRFSPEGISQAKTEHV